MRQGMNDQMGKWIHEWMKQTSCNFLRWDTREGVQFREHGNPSNERQGQLGFMSTLHAAWQKAFRKEEEHELGSE